MQSDGKLLTINEPNKLATQRKIIELLKLDYDTFVASAFLQQGKADAFTLKPPAERKRVLGEILGLEQWSVYEERAKEKIKSIETEITAIDLTLREITAELKKEPQYQRELAAAEAAHAEAQQALSIAQKALEEVATAPTELRAKQEALEGQQRTLREHQKDAQTAAAEITRIQTNLQRYETMLAKQAEIEQGYTALQHARETDTELGAKLSELSDLDQQINQLERHIASEQAVLEREHSTYTTTIAEAERLLQGDTRADLAQVEAHITLLEQRETEREALVADVRQLEKERSTQEETRRNVEAEGKKLNKRMDNLQAVATADCPLCGQPLTPEHRQNVLHEWTQERDAHRASYQQAQQRLKDLDRQIKDAEKQLEALAEELQRLPALRKQLGALNKQHDDATAAEARRAAAQTQLNLVTAALEAQTFAQEAREQLAALRQHRAAIGYDRTTHESARAHLLQYRDYELQFTQLEIARNALPAEQAALENVTARQARLQHAITETTEAIEALQHDIEKLKLRVAEQQRRQTEVNKQHTLFTQAEQRKWNAEQALTSLESQRARQTNYETRRDNLLREKAVYDELKYAFGKNGVPAMMIETAIPELEADANDLLAKMTDGRMHLRLTTQREKVSGGSMETLDIEIADDLGERSYEMYSGGEAFRINFAIRIALSKMLARRAGAHLRTLFIDEGFGTQDDDGRAKLIEAINAIQHEFELILVITHIDELRDSFPVHIIVEKTPNGSLVSLR
jgi:exonuclease SbcC